MKAITLARLMALAAASLGLSACAPPPLFAEGPPARTEMPVPAHAPGLWAKEGRDNGDRVRVVATGPTSLRLEIFNTQPKADEPAPPPLAARTVQFAGRDWLMLDVGAWPYGREERGEMNGWLPLQLEFESPSRVCLQVPAAATFAAAVGRGELAGKIEPGRPPLQGVLVTSRATDWMAWWHQHASDVVMTQERLCLRRDS